MMIESDTATMIPQSEYSNAARVPQKQQHTWHLAIFPITSAIASHNPKCCIRTALIAAHIAIHTITCSFTPR